MTVRSSTTRLLPTPSSPTPQQLQQLLLRQRSAEVVPLHGTATVLAQESELAVGLDPLGDHLEIEVARQGDDGQRDGAVVRLVGQPGDEGAGDLEGVCPGSWRRVPRAE